MKKEKVFKEFEEFTVDTEEFGTVEFRLINDRLYLGGALGHGSIDVYAQKLEVVLNDINLYSFLMIYSRGYRDDGLTNNSIVDLFWLDISSRGAKTILMGDIPEGDALSDMIEDVMGKFLFR